MLDSFLFSLMTGTQVPDDGDRRGICAIAWMQGAVATGMFAAGATALFGGLGWMLASHTVKKMPSEDTKAIDFVPVYVRTRGCENRCADTAERTQLALRSIKVATVCMVVLAIGASWLAVTLARLPQGMADGTEQRRRHARAGTHVRISDDRLDRDLLLGGEHR